MDKKEEVYQILELGTHLKNLHHKKGFGGFLFIDLPMTKFSKLSTYIRQLDKENQKYKEVIDKAKNHCETMLKIFERMNEQQKEENLDKFKIYDCILRILSEEVE